MALDPTGVLIKIFWWAVEKSLMKILLKKKSCLEGGRSCGKLWCNVNQLIFLKENMGEWLFT